MFSYKARPLRGYTGASPLLNCCNCEEVKNIFGVLFRSVDEKDLPHYFNLPTRKILRFKYYPVKVNPFTQLI